MEAGTRDGLAGAVAQYGLDVPALLADAAATRMGAFAWLDVLVSAVVLVAFISVEGKRLGMRGGILAAIAGTLLVGVSLGLPLFLWLRERTLREHAAH